MTKRQRLHELSNEPDMVDAGMIEPEIVASKKEELEARWVPLNVLPVVTRRSKLAILSLMRAVPKKMAHFELYNKGKLFIGCLGMCMSQYGIA